ncbi:hypothetical protein DICVIV_08445 [Dictyocaulus viviparus]|uniref:Uncharacterized protein n=1 Tax=Dictyocaulus viviparus TaxID=29172 RepID=A0A0D8XP22_DICVI|nr:hypothetical protein DICVIV_08445 [Dictyocaulus viviparus]
MIDAVGYGIDWIETEVPQSADHEIPVPQHYIDENCSNDNRLPCACSVICKVHRQVGAAIELCADDVVANFVINCGCTSWTWSTFDGRYASFEAFKPSYHHVIVNDVALECIEDVIRSDNMPSHEFEVDDRGKCSIVEKKPRNRCIIDISGLVKITINKHRFELRQSALLEPQFTILTISISNNCHRVRIDRAQSIEFDRSRNDFVFSQFD